MGSQGVCGQGAGCMLVAFRLSCRVAAAEVAHAVMAAQVCHL